MGRFLPVLTGITLVVVAGVFVAIAAGFDSLYEPKPEFAAIAWVLGGIFATAGVALIVFSQRISGSK